MLLGIDIGTHSAHGAFIDRDGNPCLVNLAGGGTALPAYARQTMHGLLIGEEAAQAFIGNAETTIIGCTRLMGRAGQIPHQLLNRLPYLVRDVDGEAVCNLLYAEVRASTVFGGLVRELATAAKCMTNEVVEGIALTVPAGAEDRFRIQARAAVEAAGYPVRRLINQPTAAILGIQATGRTLAGYIAVISCQGATTEVSIAEVIPATQAHVRILATATDPLLGGDDLAWAVTERLNAYFASMHGQDVFGADQSQIAALGLRRAAEDMIRTLQSTHETPLILDHGAGFGRDLAAIVEQQDIITWLTPWFTRMANLCTQALDSANLKPDQIRHVMLIGDWTELPGLAQQIACVFKRTEHDLIRHQATVMAAYGAAYIASSAHTTLWDVTPYPLGINCYYGDSERLSPIIQANTPIPTPSADQPGAFSAQYTTRYPNQTSVTLDVLQYRGTRNADPYGTEPVTPDACEKLGTWQFSGLQPAPGETADFRVTFSVDQDGILHLRARENATGRTLEGQVARGVG